MQKTLLFILPLALASCDSPDDEEFLDADEELADADEELADGKEPKPTGSVSEFAVAEEDPDALYGCGLQTQYYGSFWAYTVVNCHPYPVSRRVVFEDGKPGACRNLGTGTPQNIFDGTSIRRPDHLIVC